MICPSGSAGPGLAPGGRAIAEKATAAPRWPPCPLRASGQSTRQAPNCGAAPELNALNTTLGCEGWPVGGHSSPARSLSGSSTPVRLVQSRYDNATPTALGEVRGPAVGHGP
ncbi:alpha/beta hydrolase [Streptomyces hawaiiensis]|uniref:alpha/beta hydrolase n=1 Tax=Streptomyces hawaiiensis TaxID=67305 RepID=UPI003CCC6029